jgi:Methyltransferase domain
MHILNRRAALGGVVVWGVGAFAPFALRAQDKAAEYRPESGQAGKDVVWVPTPDEVVQKMLDMVELKKGERVVDLGSGDGKIAIAAAQRGAVARGIEFNPDMVELSRRRAREAGVEVQFERGDIFKSDFRNADVVTLYLLPTLNERLRPTLLRMKPGTRVTSHQFTMGEWEPDQTAEIGSRRAHLWIVPAQLEGRWQVQLDGQPEPIALRLRQRFQMIDGSVQWNGREARLSQARVVGPSVGFTLVDADGASHRFEGRADSANRMSGRAVAQADGRGMAFVASR